jgi:hypothetical protein
MTNRKVLYPLIQVLIDELKEFEKTETAAGNIRYSAPEGKHDDCVIALALCVWGIKRIILGNVETFGKQREAIQSKEF